jgi:hypothetical protein
MADNTSDKSTLRDFLAKIEKQYGKAERIWVMDRGIPSEEILAKRRASDSPVSYLVGTLKGRLSKLKSQLVDLPWQKVREGIDVKLLSQEGELYRPYYSPTMPTNEESAYPLAPHLAAGAVRSIHPFDVLFDCFIDLSDT